MTWGKIGDPGAVDDVRGSAAGRIAAAIRHWMDAIFSGAQTTAQEQADALRSACCGLLTEVARLESAHPARKREAAARAVAELFAISPDESTALIAAFDSRANHYTSYYDPVALINKLWPPPEKVRLVEHLWRVAMADGNLDMYEEHLVRKLADLLYVSHTDFILAKHRALDYRRLGRRAK